MIQKENQFMIDVKTTIFLKSYFKTLPLVDVDKLCVCVCVCVDR